MCGACTSHERDDMHTTFLVEKMKGRDHSEELRGYEDNIRTGLREIEWEGVDWMRLA
jgi:hypothetical protein